jgi:hypothetical protein
MEKWEYKHEWVERPYRTSDWEVKEPTMNTLNEWGDKGWEVCTVLEDQGFWLVLLKRKMS